jgi:hypothetical protein
MVKYRMGRIRKGVRLAACRQVIRIKWRMIMYRVVMGMLKMGYRAGASDLGFICSSCVGM